MNLEPHIIEALRPLSILGWLKQRLARGQTAVQIFLRLPQAIQRDLVVQSDNILADATSQAMVTLQRSIDGLVLSGVVEKRQVAMQAREGRGPRTVWVDVYRLVR